MKGPTTFISAVAFSGSTDYLRNAIGGSWEVTEVATPAGTPVEEQEILSTIPLFGTTADGAPAKRDCISHVYIGGYAKGGIDGDMTDTSEGKLISNYRFNVRIVGNPSYIKSDAHWKTLIAGGHFGGSTYSPILQAGYYQNKSFSYYIPYTAYEYNGFLSAGGEDVDYLSDMPKDPIEIKSVYNVRLPKYEEYAKNINTERLLPNIYWLRSFNLFPPGEYSVGDTMVDMRDELAGMGEAEAAAAWASQIETGVYGAESTAITRNIHYIQAAYSSSISNFVTLEGNVPASALGQPEDLNSDGAYGNLNYQGYLSSSVILNSLSASTIEQVDNLHKNIIFDNDAVAGEFSVLDEMKSTLHDVYQDPMSANEDFEYAINYTTRYPYYISIKIPSTVRALVSFADEDLQKIFETRKEEIDPAKREEFEDIALEILGGDGTGFTTHLYGIPEATEAKFYKYIRETGFSSKFLKSLKEVFVTGSSTLLPRQTDFTAYSEYKKINVNDSLASSTVYDAVSASTQAFRSVPVMDLLVYSHNHYRQEMAQDDCCFVGPNNFNRLAAMDRIGEYRYANTTDAIEMIDSTIDFLGTSVPIDTPHEDDLPGGVKMSQRDMIHSLSEIYDCDPAEAASRHHVETIAFRIEKIGGLPTGDSRTENVIQNIWIFNSFTGAYAAAKTYIDSQIKYGQNYTYNIYAYVIVQGLKYKYDNIALSRAMTNPVATTEEMGLPTAGIDKMHCIEYYNPDTDETVTPLPMPSVVSVDSVEASDSYWLGDRVEEGAFDEGGAMGARSGAIEGGAAISSFDWSETEFKVQRAIYEGEFGSLYQEVTADNPFSNRAAAMSNVVQLSNDQYRAEFTIQTEPSLDIIEVPIFSKTIKVLDNPPNRLQVEPFQIDDNTQRVGFALKYAADHTDTYPAVLSTSDLNIKEDYMNAQDFIPNQAIAAWAPGSTEYGSRSRPSEIQVYRLSMPPSSVSDFRDSLRATIDLSIAPETKLDAKKTVADYYDTVRTNHKYYYVFRAINENGMPGDLSPIYETQLVDDGGYKFAIFNTMSEEELYSRPIEVSKKFKKVLEVVPNVNHTMLNTANVDFTQPAHTQLSTVYTDIGASNLEDVIWGNTYKFRLTSKKTGRKIDLNIKYNLNSE